MEIAVTLRGIANADDRQKAHIEKAVSRLRFAVNQPEFPERVLGADYRRTRWRYTSGNWRSLTPAEILQRINWGRERATPIDGEIDLKLALIRTKPGVLGSTSLGHLPIRPGFRFINRCVAANDTVNLAGHLMHEWMHVSGFYHSPDNGARQDTAYVLGDIVRGILHKSFADEDDRKIAAMMEDENCGCVDHDPGKAEGAEMAGEADE